MESYLLHQERCPECAKQGKDTNGNNLAVYSDGHQWCYSCGYYVSASAISKFKARESKSGVGKPARTVILPQDCDVNYPQKAMNWIEKYDLTKTDLLNNGVLWSDSTKRLIFPIYAGETGIVAYQGRYFGEETKPKWYTVGNVKDIFHILGKSTSQIVLVEDIVSAIKLAKVTMAMPIFGSTVGIVRFKRLYSLYGKTLEVVLWLDPDMRKQMVLEARRGMLCGLRTQIIFSNADPKEESVEQIQEMLNWKR